MVFLNISNLLNDIILLNYGAGSYGRSISVFETSRLSPNLNHFISIIMPKNIIIYPPVANVCRSEAIYSFVDDTILDKWSRRNIQKRNCTQVILGGASPAVITLPTVSFTIHGRILTALFNGIFISDFSTSGGEDTKAYEYNYHFPSGHPEIFQFIVINLQ